MDPTRIVRSIPAAKAMAQKLRAQSPATMADPRTSILPGHLILDRALIILVNNTGSAVGSGATQTAPFCCHIYYQNTNFYSIPWCGATPSTGQTMVLSQPPLLYVLGHPSNQ